MLASAGAFDYSSTSSADFCVGDVAIPGCTDETACNYNADATEDDGSCATLIMNFSTSNDTWTGETGFNVVNNDTGEIVDSMSAGSYGGGLGHRHKNRLTCCQRFRLCRY